MESAFSKNFADLDSDSADADSFFGTGAGSNDKMKEKGQVGLINPDHIDF